MSILIATLRDDILDRLQSYSSNNQISEEQKIVLSSPARITLAMNNALKTIVGKLEPKNLKGFKSVVAPTADGNFGETGSEGIFGNLKVYVWPAECFIERVDSGLLAVVIGGAFFRPSESYPLESIKQMSKSTFFSDVYPAFHLDSTAHKIFVFKDVSVKVEVITTPLEIKNENTYNAVNNIPISKDYYGEILSLCLSELIGQPTNQPINEVENE